MTQRQTTYTQARATFACLCDEVAEGGTSVLITRRGAQDVALIGADELASILETAHLLRSPENARRLLAAQKRFRSGRGKPSAVDKLREEMGLGKE